MFTQNGRKHSNTKVNMNFQFKTYHMSTKYMKVLYSNTPVNENVQESQPKTTRSVQLVSMVKKRIWYLCPIHRLMESDINLLVTCMKMCS